MNVATVGASIDKYRFNDAAEASFRFVWNTFCYWHLELAKPILQGDDRPEKDETRATVAHVFDLILTTLHPFMPFLTEELWTARGGAGVLALGSWPQPVDLSDTASEGEIGWVVDLISEVRSVRSEMGVPAGAQVPIVLVSPSAETQSRIEAWGETIRRLARISDITAAPAAPEQSLQLIVRGEVAALPLAGIIDIEAETARLTKERGKLDGEIAKIDAKLGNADFLARAPEEVVDEQRERRAEAEARRAKIDEALARLSTSPATS